MIMSSLLLLLLFVIIIIIIIYANLLFYLSLHVIHLKKSTDKKTENVLLKRELLFYITYFFSIHNRALKCIS